MSGKILLEHIDVPGINTFDTYRKMGGYRSVEKALKTMSPEDVVEEVKKSGMRGRGGIAPDLSTSWRMGNGAGATGRSALGRTWRKPLDFAGASG